jgi:GNAT superfamily N-acetyltransferase
MKIRPAEKADARQISKVYVQTWQDTYLGLVPFGYLYGMSPISLSQDFEHHLIDGHDINYVAEDKGRIIGFINGGGERRGDSIYCGEIYALYVLKKHQRQGIGTGLVAALVSELNAYGIHSMMVRVLSHNPYRNFYEKINGVFLHKQRRRFAGEMLEISAYGWIDTGLVNVPSA